MGRCLGTTAAPQYRLHWGAGYTPVPDETQSADWFEEDLGYSPQELKQISRLKPGQHVTFNDVRHPERGSQLVHTVTRLS